MKNNYMLTSKTSSSFFLLLGTSSNYKSTKKEGQIRRTMIIRGRWGVDWMRPKWLPIGFRDRSFERDIID